MRRPLVDRAIITSAQVDPARTGIGSSPFVGDASHTGLVVPEAPTTSQNTRYLFRLCAVGVPSDSICILHNFRQLLYIGCDQPTEEDQDDEQWRVEIPVTDPLWSFPDGNVSWHIRTVRPFHPDVTFIPPDVGASIGQSGRGDTTDSALLSVAPAPGAYGPLNGGMPYGRPLAGLGTIRDMRYPWSNRGTSLGLEIAGPVTLAMYASVYQTDPDRRPNKPVGIETAGLRNEDVFMFNWPQAKYTRVGGRMDVEIVNRSGK
jgi:hypothetical protein